MKESRNSRIISYLLIMIAVIGVFIFANRENGINISFLVSFLKVLVLSLLISGLALGIFVLIMKKIGSTFRGDLKDGIFLYFIYSAIVGVLPLFLMRNYHLGMVFFSLIPFVIFLFYGVISFLRKNKKKLLDNGQPLKYLEKTNPKYVHWTEWSSALSLAGKWRETLAFIEEQQPKIKNDTERLFYYNRKFVTYLDLEELENAQQAYQKFCDYAENGSHSFGQDIIDSLKESYHSFYNYQADKSQENLKRHLESSKKTRSLINNQTLWNQIVIHYYQGLYELNEGNKVQAAIHFNFIINNENTTWYKAAAENQMKKL